MAKKKELEREGKSYVMVLPEELLKNMMITYFIRRMGASDERGVAENAKDIYGFYQMIGSQYIFESSDGGMMPLWDCEGSQTVDTAEYFIAEFMEFYLDGQKKEEALSE